MYTYEAIQVGLSADELTALYSSFYTQRLADECQRLNRDISNLKAKRDLADYDVILLRDLKRRLRIAKRVLATRQPKIF